MFPPNLKQLFFFLLKKMITKSWSKLQKIEMLTVLTDSVFPLCKPNKDIVMYW